MAKNGFKLFDSDMHVQEPWDLWLRYIDPEYKDVAPVGTSKSPLTMNMAIQARHLANFLRDVPVGVHEEEKQRKVEEKERASKYLQFALERNFDAESQLHAMNVEGLDTAAIYPTRGMQAAGYDYEDGKHAAAIASAYNNWLSDFCSYNHVRMKGIAMVLPHDVEEAVAETRRAVEELGFIGIYLHPNPIRDRNWHDPTYDPLWAECQRLNAAVTFHETFKCGLPQAVAERFYKEQDKIWLMAHVACHTVEQMYASLCICMGGVLEKFPNLRVAFLECNSGWAPFWLWRMDEHYEQRQKQAARHLKMVPSEYFKRQCYLAIDADEGPAKYAIDWVGDNNFVFSTDYPHTDAKYPFASDTFLKLPLPDLSKRKVLWDNPLRLYKLAT